MATTTTTTTTTTNSYITSSSVLSAFLVCFSLFLCSSNKGFAFGHVEESAVNSHDHHLVKTTSLLPSSVCIPPTKDLSKRGSLKVVHRHGPCSQHNEDQAIAPTLTEIMSHDESRVNSIQHRLGSKNKKRNSSRATIPDKSASSLGYANYIVTVGLGTPKRNLSLVFDTGSGLTWTQCQPCVRCYKQQEPLFDPAVSKSYRNFTCNSAACSQLNTTTGNSQGCATSTCIYAIQYGDSSFTVGFLASEKLTLTPRDVFPNFIFGCGKNNQGLFRGIAGLLGLDRDRLSTVSQTASKFGKYFSYCLPSPSSPSGSLTFGKGGTASTSLQFTPSPVNPKAPSFYFITITGIKVGGQKLSISESVFATGTIIDSGTVITRLQTAAYAALRASFRQAMTAYNLTRGVSLFDTCYDLSSYETVRVPKISFLFAGNIEVPIDLSGTLTGNSITQVCLAFAGNRNASSVGIFGNVQQRTLDVVHDIPGGQIGFGTGGCA